MKPKKIFISFNEHNGSTAREMKSMLKKIFEDSIEVFLSATDINGGAQWEEELKKNLEKSDGLISILTSNYIRRGWFFIEWTPFWLQNKPFFFLAYGTIDFKELVGPMLKNQTSSLNDEHSIQNFLQGLHSFIFDSENEDIDKYKNYAKTFKDTIKGSLDEEGKSFPVSSTIDAKTDIVLNLYGDENIDQILSLIKGEEGKNKSAIASKVLEKNNLELMMLICRTIEGAASLQNITNKMISKGFIETNEIFELVGIIAKKNEAVLSRVAEYLIECNETHSRLFKHVVDLLFNRAHLKKVSDLYLQIENPDFNTILSILLKMLDKPNTYGKPFLKGIKTFVPEFLLPLYKEVSPELSEGDEIYLWFKENLTNFPDDEDRGENDDKDDSDDNNDDSEKDNNNDDSNK